MLYNQPDGDMFTLKGAKLRKVDDFIQLWSWIQSCQKDMKTRIAHAWRALYWKNMEIKPPEKA